MFSSWILEHEILEIMICQKLETSTDVVMFPNFEENSPMLLKAADNYVKSMFSLKLQTPSQTTCASYDSLEKDFLNFEKSNREIKKSSSASKPSCQKSGEENRYFCS